MTLPTPPASGEPPAPPAEVGEEISFTNVVVSNRRGRWQIVGEATNNEGTEVSARLKATFYDAEGKLIGTGSGFISQLAAGQTKTIEFRTVDDVSDYSSMKLMADHIYRHEL